MAAHKAFLFVKDESNNWSSNSIDLSFDEEDEITSLPQPLPLEGSRSAHWYTLDGRKLQGEPATTGIYIYNGKKIVIPSKKQRLGGCSVTGMTMVD
jgi:hypothetical protein